MKFQYIYILLFFFYQQPAAKWTIAGCSINKWFNIILYCAIIRCKSLSWKTSPPTGENEIKRNNVNILNAFREVSSRLSAIAGLVKSLRLIIRHRVQNNILYYNNIDIAIIIIIILSRRKRVYRIKPFLKS